MAGGYPCGCCEEPVDCGCEICNDTDVGTHAVAPWPVDLVFTTSGATGPLTACPVGCSELNGAFASGGFACAVSFLSGAAITTDLSDYDGMTTLCGCEVVQYSTEDVSDENCFASPSHATMTIYVTFYRTASKLRVFVQVTLEGSDSGGVGCMVVSEGVEDVEASALTTDCEDIDVTVGLTVTAELDGTVECDYKFCSPPTSIRIEGALA